MRKRAAAAKPPPPPGGIASDALASGELAKVTRLFLHFGAMSERDLDTDIDFDFFEDEPPTEEAAGTERAIRVRRPRGPRRPPRAPTDLTPLLRLVGLIAFAILIVVLLVFWIQSCQESSKNKTYKGYMGKVSEVASASQTIGRQLSNALLQTGVRQASLQRRIAGFARQEQLDVERAREITPPGRLRDEHAAVVEALQFRVSGLNGLANALAATANTKDVDRAAAVLASQMQRLLASDVVWDDGFKSPSEAVLRRQGVTGTNDSGGPLVPDSNFLQSSDLVTATALSPVLQRIRGGGVKVTPGTVRGTNIESTEVLPAGTELSAGSSNTVTVTTDMAFRVTVKDSGESQEVQLPVTLTIEQAGAEPIRKTQRIPFINAGDTQAVTFRNFPAPKFGSQATIRVEVKPVPGEKITDNNSAEYPVIFSVPG